MGGAQNRLRPGSAPIKTQMDQCLRVFEESGLYHDHSTVNGYHDGKNKQPLQNRDLDTSRLIRYSSSQALHFRLGLAEGFIMNAKKNNSDEGVQSHISGHAPIKKNKHTIKPHGSDATSSISGVTEKNAINPGQRSKERSGNSPDADEAVEQVSESANVNVDNEASYGASANRRTSIEDSEAGTDKEGSGNFSDSDGAIEQVSEGANLNVENEVGFGSSASRRTSIEDSEV